MSAPKSNKSLRQRVFERDGYKCLRCGSVENITLDHITPRCKGGKNTIENLQTLCADCNGKKATKNIDYRKAGTSKNQIALNKVRDKILMI